MDNIVPENGVLRNVIVGYAFGTTNGASMSADASGTYNNVHGFVNVSGSTVFFLSTDSGDPVLMSASGTCERTSNQGNQPPSTQFSNVVNRTLYVSATSASYAPSSWNGVAGVLTAVDLTATTAYAIGSKQEMIGPVMFKGRGYWWKNRMNPQSKFWYASDAVGAVGGELRSFNLATFADGTIIALASWSVDGGAGPDDYFVILFDTGTVLVYQGIWPEDVDGWALVGRYKIPRPITPNAVQSIGGKILVVTEQDYILLPDALIAEGALVSESKIAPRVRELMQNRNLRSLWQTKFFPNKGWIVVKAPLSTLDSEFHLQTREGSWFRVTSASAVCMTEVEGRLVYLRANPNPALYEFNRRPMRTGDPLTGDMRVKTSWNFMGTRGQKQITGLRVQVGVSASGSGTDSFPGINYEVHADFDETDATAAVIGAQLSSWATSGSAVSNSWVQAYQHGQHMSVQLRLDTGLGNGGTNSEIEIRDIDVLVAALNEIA